VIGDESHVSVGGLLGTTQLGLDFDEDSKFSGVECEVNDAMEHELDHAIEHQS